MEQGSKKSKKIQKSKVKAPNNEITEISKQKVSENYREIIITVIVLILSIIIGFIVGKALFEAIYK